MHYSPVRHSSAPEGLLPFDLHVLGMPPAFNLSQDQTLQFKFSVTLRVTKPFAMKSNPLAKTLTLLFRFDVIAYIGIHWHILP